MGDIYKINNLKVRVAEIIQKTGLTPEQGKKISQLSKGYRQRVGLAAALIHNPEILILDEPTTGLDPNQLVEIRNLIKKVGKDKTVLLSTHIMQEVDKICNRVIIINKGKIVEDQLISNFQKDNIDLDEAETYSESIAIHLDDDFAAGTYNILIKSYYDEDEYDDNDITDYKTVSLVVEDCGTTTAPTTAPTTTTTAPTTTITTAIPTSTEISFTDSSGYVLTLVLVNVLLLVAILFVVIKQYILGL